MDDFTVSEFLLPHEAYPEGCRDLRLIGVFTVRIGPVLLQRCCLRLKLDGKPTASLPAARDRDAKVSLATGSSRERLLDLALAALHERGGRVPCPTEVFPWEQLARMG